MRVLTIHELIAFLRSYSVIIGNVEVGSKGTLLFQNIARSIQQLLVVGAEPVLSLPKELVLPAIDTGKRVCYFYTEHTFIKEWFLGKKRA